MELMLIDDCPDMREIVSAMLVAAIPGIVIYEYASAEDALKSIFGGYEYDLILTDQDMDGASGCEFIWSIREMGVETPTLLYTAGNIDEITAPDGVLKFSKLRMGDVVMEIAARDKAFKVMNPWSIS